MDDHNVIDKLIILDAGHAGIIEGVYATPGKRDYIANDKLAEGALNRAVVHLLAHRLHSAAIPVHILAPENEDITLATRVKRANDLARRYKCLLLSIHHNAFTDRRVNGYEIYTSLGDTAADPIAEYIAARFMLWYPKRRIRIDMQKKLRYSKEAPYYILKHTICPAILSEWGFMTNDTGDYNERTYITSNIGIIDQVEFYYDQLITIYNEML